MIALALARSLEVTLNNHIFRFGNKLYRQSNGGAIGVGIAGDGANFFMVWWDRELKEKLQEEGVKLKMYSRYVDDINIVCEVIDRKVEGEEMDETTMKSIQKHCQHNSREYQSDYRLPIIP